MQKNRVIQLYPVYRPDRDLEGLYLGRQDDIKPGENAYVYTNFITSLDGRIAIEQPVTGKRGVPRTITNSRDWRLYQELAACADVLLVSARYIRELSKGTAQDSLPLSSDPAFTDLVEWRKQNRSTDQPAVVILSASLDLPIEQVCHSMQRSVYVATGEHADEEAVNRIERAGGKILFAGVERKVDGQTLVQRLTELGFRSIYSIAGPGVLETLLTAGVLDRIYLTQVHRMLGGASYDTLLEGNLLSPPADFSLDALYYDANDDDDCSQMFGIYNRTAAKHCGKPE